MCHAVSYWSDSTKRGYSVHEAANTTRMKIHLVSGIIRCVTIRASVCTIRYIDISISCCLPIVFGSTSACIISAQHNSRITCNRLSFISTYLQLHMHARPVVKWWKYLENWTGRRISRETHKISNSRIQTIHIKYHVTLHVFSGL